MYVGISDEQINENNNYSSASSPNSYGPLSSLPFRCSRTEPRSNNAGYRQTKRRNSTRSLLLNARSIRNKTTEIRELVYERNLDIVFIVETWLNGDVSDGPSIVDLVPPGYKFINLPRTDAVGGGIGVIHKANATVKTTYPMSFRSMELAEFTFTSINGPIKIVLVYRPPPSQTNKLTSKMFLSDLSELLDLYALDHSRIIYLGDFNVRINKPSQSDTVEYVNLLTSHGLHQHVKQPTHISGNTLDHIITHEEEPGIKISVCKDSAISDHYPISFTIETLKMSETKRKQIRYRSTRNLDPSVLASHLENCVPVHEAHGAEAKYDELQSIMTKAMDSLAPVKTKIVSDREPEPWITPGIFKAREERRKAERAWRRTGSATLKKIFNRKRNEVTHLIRTSKNEYLTVKLAGCTQDQRKFFRSAKSLLGTGGKPEELPDSVDEASLANEFNEFFVTKIQKINEELVKERSFLTSPTTDECDYSGTRLSTFRPTSREEVMKLITDSPSATCDLDAIPTKFLKESDVLEKLIDPIVEVINESLRSGIVPSAMKSAIIKPLLKKSTLDKNLMKNYRPVSNLSFISKLLEKCVATRITEHMKDNSLQEPLQSAYRSGHSTETTLMRVTNDILTSADDPDTTVLLLLLDLSAAFDTVDHELLLKRLQTTFGLNNTVIKWFQSYLSGRTQSVKIGSHVSAKVPLTTGVPQGSVLGPFIFTMYTQPLGKLISSHGIQHHFYADDTQLYISFKNRTFNTAKMRIESCIRDIREWMTFNRLKLNDNKTELLPISAQHEMDQTLHITVGNDNVKPVNKVRNLGAILDSKLSFDAHINTVCKTSYAHLRAISKIRRYISEENARSLVQALVISRIDSLNALLVGLPDRALKPLIRVQNTAARLITKTRKYDHISPILRKLHWLPVPQRIQFKVLIMTFKCVHGLAPGYLSDLLQIHVPNRSQRSIHQLQLIVPQPQYSKFGKAKYFDRSFQASATKLWNELPTDLRCHDRLSTFRKALKTHLFRNAYGL